MDINLIICIERFKGLLLVYTVNRDPRMRGDDSGGGVGMTANNPVALDRVCSFVYLYCVTFNPPVRVAGSGLGSCY